MSVDGDDGKGQVDQLLLGKLALTRCNPQNDEAVAACHSVFNLR